jgi:hypothetical protein
MPSRMTPQDENTQISKELTSGHESRKGLEAKTDWRSAIRLLLLLHSHKDYDSFVWQTRPPIRVDAPRQTIHKYSLTAKILPWVPIRGSKPRPTYWLSAEIWLWLWHSLHPSYIERLEHSLCKRSKIFRSNFWQKKKKCIMSYRNDSYQGPSNIHQNDLPFEKWAIKRQVKTDPL